MSVKYKRAVKEMDDRLLNALELLYSRNLNHSKETLDSVAQKTGLTSRQAGKFHVVLRLLNIIQTRAGWETVVDYRTARMRLEQWAVEREQATHPVDIDKVTLKSAQPTKEKTMASRVPAWLELALLQFYDEYVPSTPITFRSSYRDVGNRLGLTDHQAVTFKNMLEASDVLSTAAHYEKGRSGKVSEWTIAVPLDEAKEKLHKHLSNPKPVVKKPVEYQVHDASFEVAVVEEPLHPSWTAKVIDEPVAVATSETEEVRAIAGPEAESQMEPLRAIRKDEPRALVAAADQYERRFDAVKEKYQELVDMGVTIDETQFFASVTMETDDRLASIALVLPYIHSLEKEIRIREQSPRPLNEGMRKQGEQLERQRTYIGELEDKVRRLEATIRAKEQSVEALNRELADTKVSLRTMGARPS